MANEIKGTLSLQVNSDTFDFQQALSFDADQAGVGGGNPGVVDIGTGDEAIDFGDLTGALGWALIRNTDATNFVEYGPEASGSLAVFGKLLPGEATLIRLSPLITMRARADAAVVRMSISVFAN